MCMCVCIVRYRQGDTVMTTSSCIFELEFNAIFDMGDIGCAQSHIGANARCGGCAKYAPAYMHIHVL